MKSLMLFLSTAAFMTSAFAQSECSNYMLVEQSRVTLTLINTAHDRMGNIDEINVELSTSLNKLNEEDMFSDFFGAKTYKQSPEYFWGNQKNEVSFNQTKTVFQKSIPQSALYNNHLNILMVEEDVAVPLASGSIEVPFYLATGGNHDDLLFSKSVKLDLSHSSEVKFSLRNEFNDVLKVSITPEQKIKITNSDLKNKYISARNELNKINSELKNEKSDSYKKFTLNKDFNIALSKATYLKDILDGKVEGACLQ